MPVPIAQTGSYAMTILEISSMPFIPSVICLSRTASVLPVSRSSSVSPMQTMGTSPAESAVRVRLFTVLAAFAVTDNDVFYVVFFKHICGNFPRIRAFFGEVHVLCAERNIAAFQCFGYGGNIDCGNANDDFAIGIFYKGL